MVGARVGVEVGGADVGGRGEGATVFVGCAATEGGVGVTVGCGVAHPTINIVITISKKSFRITSPVASNTECLEDTRCFGKVASKIF